MVPTDSHAAPIPDQELLDGLNQCLQSHCSAPQHCWSCSMPPMRVFWLTLGATIAELVHCHNLLSVTADLYGHWYPTTVVSTSSNRGDLPPLQWMGLNTPTSANNDFQWLTRPRQGQRNILHHGACPAPSRRRPNAQRFSQANGA